MTMTNFSNHPSTQAPRIAVVLAGGRGTRLGATNKALRLLAGRPLLQHVLDRIRPQVDRVVIGGGARAAELAGFGVEVVADASDAEHLPGSFRGLHAAFMLASGSGAESVLTIPTDTPFLPRGLAQALGVGAVAIARDDARIHAIIGCWSREAAERALAALAAYNNESVEAFARGRGAAVVPVQLRRDESFLNVNTAEDLAAAEEFLRKGRV